MRVLPCGSAGLLVELDALDDVLALYAALDADRPLGVVDLVPAARTLLLQVDPAAGDLAAVERAVREARPQRGAPAGRATGDVVEVPVVYDGEDLEEVGEITGWGADGVVERHTAQEWTVAFCGFAPGFGYLVARGGAASQDSGGAARQDSGGAARQDSGGAARQDSGGAARQDSGGAASQDSGGAASRDSGGGWDVPRRSSPRTRVPAGSVALAGEFTGVYPRESPGGWQLLGRTELDVFDLHRDPPALLVPGARVRFSAVEAGS